VTLAETVYLSVKTEHILTRLDPISVDLLVVCLADYYQICMLYVFIDEYYCGEPVHVIITVPNTAAIINAIWKTVLF
jgi:hypothetical protein